MAFSGDVLEYDLDLDDIEDGDADNVVPKPSYYTMADSGVGDGIERRSSLTLSRPKQLGLSVKAPSTPSSSSISSTSPRASVADEALSATVTEVNVLTLKPAKFAAPVDRSSKTGDGSNEHILHDLTGVSASLDFVRGSADGSERPADHVLTADHAQTPRPSDGSHSASGSVGEAGPTTPRGQPSPSNRPGTARGLRSLLGLKSARERAPLEPPPGTVLTCTAESYWGAVVGDKLSGKLFTGRPLMWLTRTHLAIGRSCGQIVWPLASLRVAVTHRFRHGQLDMDFTHAGLGRLLELEGAPVPNADHAHAFVARMPAETAVIIGVRGVSDIDIWIDRIREFQAALGGECS